MGANTAPPAAATIPSQGQQRLRLLGLAVLSVLLLSLSGILFAASLWIGKGLESPVRRDHALLVRANNRLWYFVPFQLMAIAIVAWILVVKIPIIAATRRSKVFQKFLLFLGGFLLLLLLDYFGGIVLFEHWGLTVVHWLENF